MERAPSDRQSLREAVERLRSEPPVGLCPDLAVGLEAGPDRCLALAQKLRRLRTR